MSEDRQAENKQLLLALEANKSQVSRRQKDVRNKIVAGIIDEDPKLGQWLLNVLKIYK